MTIKTVADTVSEYARRRKERLLDEATPFLVAVRDGRPVSVLSSDDLNPLVQLAGIAAAGYGAEALALVVEGLFPLVEKNPLTGQAWQPGEAEQAWRAHDGVEKGWVTEAQLTGIALRDGPSGDLLDRFRIVGASVVWRAEPEWVEPGGLANALTSSFTGPVLDPARVPDPGDGFVGDPENGPFYSPDHGRVSLDVGCTRALGNRLRGRGGACVIVETQGRADYLTSEGLSSDQVEVLS